MWLVENTNKTTYWDDFCTYGIMLFIPYQKKNTSLDVKWAKATSLWRKRYLQVEVIFQIQSYSDQLAYFLLFNKVVMQFTKHR